MVAAKDVDKAVAQRGFTLLEMVVVIAIVALISSAAAALIGHQSPQRRLRAEVIQVAQALRDTKLRSVLTGKPAVVTRETLQARVRGSVVLRTWEGAEVATATFNPEGFSDIAIVDVSDHKSHRLISVSPLTGRVALQGSGNQ